MIFKQNLFQFPVDRGVPNCILCWTLWTEDVSHFKFNNMLLHLFLADISVLIVGC